MVVSNGDGDVAWWVIVRAVMFGIYRDVWRGWLGWWCVVSDGEGGDMWWVMVRAVMCGEWWWERWCVVSDGEGGDVWWVMVRVVMCGEWWWGWWCRVMCRDARWCVVNDGEGADVRWRWWGVMRVVVKSVIYNSEWRRVRGNVLNNDSEERWLEKR